MSLFDVFRGKNSHKQKFAAKEEKIVAHKKREERSALIRRRAQAELKKEEAPVEVHSRNKLGVCVPEHAKSRDAKYSLAMKAAKLVQKKNESSPFEKLVKEREKSDAEFEKEFEEITSQVPEEPYDFEPELGVESVEEEKEQKFANSDPEYNQRKAKLMEEVRQVMYRGNPPKAGSVQKKEKNLPKESSISFDEEKKDEIEKRDEIDETIDMIEGYTPKFSSIARKKFSSSKEKDPVIEQNSFGSFSVTGVYQGGDTVVITGEVTSGKITKRMTAQKGTSTVRVGELKKGLEAVEELYEGEHGSIFTRGFVPNIKYGDVLDFE